MTGPVSFRQMQIDANRTGIECPKCGCKDFRTDKTKQLQSSVHRWKTCRHCGHGVLTATESTERIVRDVKRQNKDEPESMIRIVG